jgi:hypothetical protein
VYVCVYKWKMPQAVQGPTTQEGSIFHVWQRVLAHEVVLGCSHYDAESMSILGKLC